MIGYVKIYKPELKMKDLQVYNAYYCGICKALGKKYGLIYRNLLNYDAVFLAAALDSINEYKSGYEYFRCILHPTKKKLRCNDNRAAEYAADVTVFMTYLKLRDDAEDDKSIIAGLSAAAFKSAYEKAEQELVNTGEYVLGQLKRLHGLEAEGSDSIDETADCYGNIYRKLFTERLVNREDERAVGWMAYNIGKWIYITDAVDDIESDLKKKRYNPVLNRFPIKNGTGIAEYKSEIRDRLSFILYSALEEASKAYDLIDKSVNSAIIKNILYEGMYSVTEKILSGTEQCKNDNNSTSI